jgi:hypothetical protein
MKASQYKFDLSSDSGPYTLLVWATSPDGAKAIVLATQNCPESSIKGWVRVVSKKALAKTKSLMRGL